MLDFLRKGDVLMVTRIDRLARSIGDLQDIVRAIKARDASLKATEQPIDTGTAAGKCFLDMLGVFAEFEPNLRRERQLEGIAKAKPRTWRQRSMMGHRQRLVSGDKVDALTRRGKRVHLATGPTRCDEAEGKQASASGSGATVRCRFECGRRAPASVRKGRRPVEAPAVTLSETV